MLTPRLLALPLLAAAVLTAAPTAAAAPPSPRLVTGTFIGAATGQASFRSDGAGQTWVVATLRGLTPGSAYFVAPSGNAGCESDAFLPAGPVVADRYGRVNLVTTISTGDADVVASRSVSIRQGDTYRDLDGDGIRGPIDVVGVTGSPDVGLVACDTNPKMR